MENGNINGTNKHFAGEKMFMVDTHWLNLRSRLKSFILSKIHDMNLAEDILQEVFLKMHTRIDSLKDHDKLQSWVFRITRNLIVDHYRRKKRNIPSDGLENDIEDQVIDMEIMGEATRDMVHMMDNLPSEYCEALCMTELEGMSQAEYAEKAGIPYSTAKSRVQRSRKMLKDMLMRCCHYEFDTYGTVLNISPRNCCCCRQDKSQ